MSFIMRNEGFVCENCHKKVPPHAHSARNHCPFCLYSLHVDEVFPGDRAASCGGLMEPVGIEYRTKKGDMIVHQCQRCNKKMCNQIAPDDAFLDFVRVLAHKSSPYES